MEEIMGQAKEATTTTSKASLHPKKVLLCIWWDWKGVLYYELLMKNQMINSKKYHFEVDQLKAAINEKHLGLVNSKCITFHQDNTRQHVPLMTRQKLFQSGKFWYICLIHQTLHLWISIYFGLYKIFLVKIIQFPGRLWKIPGTVLCSKR